MRRAFCTSSEPRLSVEGRRGGARACMKPGNSQEKAEDSGLASHQPVSDPEEAGAEWCVIGAEKNSAQPATQEPGSRAHLSKVLYMARGTWRAFSPMVCALAEPRARPAQASDEEQRGQTREGPNCAKTSRFHGGVDLAHFFG